MDAAKCKCIACACIWLSVCNDLIDEIVDFNRGEVVAGDAAEAAECFRCQVPDILIRMSDDSLK